MLLASFFILAHSQLVQIECEPFLTETARASLSALLDPSVSNRELLIEGLVSSVIEPLLRAGEDGTHSSSKCAADVSVRITQFATAKSLRSALEQLGQRPKRSSARPNAESERFLESLRASEERLEFRESGPARVKGDLRTPAQCQKGAHDCSDSELFALLMVAEESTIEALGPQASRSQALSRVWPVWASLAKSGGRDERLAAALRLGIASRRMEERSALDEALAELTGPVDPRAWRPADIQVILDTAHAVDEGKLPLEADPVLVEKRSPPADTDALTASLFAAADSANRDRALGRMREIAIVHLLTPLAHMGVGRTLGHLAPRSLDLALLKENVDPATLDMDVRTWRHFDGEDRLYETEWIQEHASEAPKTKEALTAMMRYVVFRWRETDSAAPHVALSGRSP